MIRQCKYPVQLKMKLDLNSDLLLTELQDVLGKNRSEIIRLIIQDFFDRKIDLLDECLSKKIDTNELATVLFRDLLDHTRCDINDYLKYKQLNETAKA